MIDCFGLVYLKINHLSVYKDKVVRMNWVTLSILSASRLIRTVWAAGRGVDPGRTVWQKLAFATVSPRSPCRGAASAWLDDAWDEAAGQWNSHFSDLHFFFLTLPFYLWF